jgi:ABC-type lipoprotein release transport system permease subunit
VTDLAAAAPGVLDKLVPGQFNIVLGAELARNLGCARATRSR